jgi:hypothetical protein
VKEAGAFEMLDEIGGPDRDRTDDVFHAMELSKTLVIDG